MAFQKLLIQYLLDPLAKMTSRIPQKAKDAGFVAFFLCIILLYMGRGAALLNFRYLIFFALGCLSLGGMILCSLPAQVKPVVFRKPLLLIWLGIGAFTLLSAFLYNSDYLPESLLFLVAYPIIFIVWNQGNRAKLFKQLFCGIEISFWLYLLVCLLFYPVEDVRYSGMFTNVNGTAGYLALVAVCLLADCLDFKKITADKIRKLIAFGICTALLLYTGSRTGILELVVVAVGAAVVSFFRLCRRGKVYLLRNALLIVASVFLFFHTTMYGLQYGYRAKTEVVTSIQGIISPTPNDGNDDPLLPDSSQQTRPEDSADLINDRFDTDGKNLSQFSTGRIQIWKGYAAQLNLFGHPDSGTVSFFVGDTEKIYHTTHMTILQIAYENGIIAGALYLLFNLTAGIYSLIHALRHKNDPYAIVPLLISLAYGVYSLLANTVSSFWYICTLMYYLAQSPIMVKSQVSLEAGETDIP